MASRALQPTGPHVEASEAAVPGYCVAGPEALWHGRIQRRWPGALAGGKRARPKCDGRAIDVCLHDKPSAKLARQVLSTPRGGLEITDLKAICLRDCTLRAEQDAEPDGDARSLAHRGADHGLWRRRESEPAQGFKAMPVGQPDFELDRSAMVIGALTALRPEAVVSCTAWAAVDAAEDAEAGASRARPLGSGQVGRRCAEAAISLIQISTDDVHDGLKGAPYLDPDLHNPLGDDHGRTELAGEWAALAKDPMTNVPRTAWVFSLVGKPFLRRRLALGATHPESRVVVGQPELSTAAPDLADAITAALACICATRWQPGCCGVVHATAQQTLHWHGFADAAPRGGPNPRALPIAAHQYLVKATRPANRRVDGTKLAENLGVMPPGLEQGLERNLRAAYRD